MNTKIKQGQKNQRQKTRPVQERKKQGQNPNMLQGRKHQEQEYPETRMTD